MILNFQRYFLSQLWCLCNVHSKGRPTLRMLFPDIGRAVDEKENGLEFFACLSHDYLANLSA